MISWVPIYSCILVAVALAGLLGKRIGVYIAPRILDRPVPRFNRVLFLLTLGTALYFLGMNLLKWRAFRVYDDTAITLQVIHNLSLGNGRRSSVQASMVGSANYFACHGSLILYPVAVLYWLLPHPATVYACWGIMLATPVWMLGRWGRNHYGETGAGLSAPLIYLSLPTLQHAGLFELH
ncbi:MAG: DUF2079 domain-containing protein, partial [Planctomycetes bacterium]|nr:DUF2079 domain-containing protein [Planctomycetota bacterium]